MSAIRDRIRAALPHTASAAAVEAWRGGKAGRRVLPAPAKLDVAHILPAFIDKARDVATEVAVLADTGAVAPAIARAIQARHLPATLVAADESWLHACLDGGLFQVRYGRPSPEDAVSVVMPAAGIAETGTLLHLSSAAAPTSLHFLPEFTIAVLARSRIVACYEEALALALAGGDALPRLLNFVTGPSRTADIEEILQLGAHGPRAVLVLIVENA